MVQEKNPAPKKNWFTEELNRIDRMHPIVATRYSVIEVTPPKMIRVGDGHGGTERDWTKEKRHVVSPYFDTREEADEWMDKHLPDEGNTLKVFKQDKRRTVSESWW